jgi:hypothetical protein
VELRGRTADDDELHASAVQRCNQRRSVSLLRMRHAGTF